MMLVTLRKAARSTRSVTILHTLADTQHAALIAMVRQALDALDEALSTEEVQQRLQQRDLASLERLVQAAWQHASSDLVTQAQATLEALAVSVGQQVALLPARAEQVVQVALEAVFNRVNTEALLYAQQASAQLVTHISSSTQQAIRETLSRAFQQGETPEQLMQALHDVVGLTPRQAQALERYREGLLASETPPAQVERLVAQRAEALLQQRLETIARTETMDAANAGQQALWEQAARDGLLPDTLRRFWVVTPDERLCPVCAPIPGLNPSGVHLNQPFQTPVGPSDGPTLHPNCRCTLTLQEAS